MSKYSNARSDEPALCIRALRSSDRPETNLKQKKKKKKTRQHIYALMYVIKYAMINSNRAIRTKHDDKKKKKKKDIKKKMNYFCIHEYLR